MHRQQIKDKTNQATELKMSLSKASSQPHSSMREFLYHLASIIYHLNALIV